MNKLIIPSKTDRLFKKIPSLLTRGHDFVEIGGIKWATCNVGAKCPTDKGLYFQWGDTKGYAAEQIGESEGKIFSWDDYEYYNEYDGVTKYNNNDEKITLESSDDAARANWGGAWRMPTTEEFECLLSSTYKERIENCVVLTDKNDKSKVLTLPIGYFAQGFNLLCHDRGYYWSSSLDYDDYDYAWALSLLKTDQDIRTCERVRGHYIRPVLDI